MKIECYYCLLLSELTARGNDASASVALSGEFTPCKLSPSILIILPSTSEYNIENKMKGLLDGLVFMTDLMDIFWGNRMLIPGPCQKL